MTVTYDKVALIGLGVLFLAGGWALEKVRRGMIALANAALVNLWMERGGK